MSLSGITIGNQNARVEIPWLSLRYVLKTSGKDAQFIEFIAEVKEGSLEILNVYVPYEISNLENITSMFLDKNNGPYYDEYIIIPSDSNNTNRGEVHLTVRSTEIKTSVQEVLLEQSKTVRGTKITIRFPNAILPGESRAVRVLFECNSLSEKEHDMYTVNLRYYGHNDAHALKLKMSEAVHVQKFRIWIVFPKDAWIDEYNPSNDVKKRKWSGRDFNPSPLEVFFGSRNTTMWKEFPIRHYEWNFGSHEPALIPWEPLPLECNYTVRNPELVEKAGMGAQNKYELWVSKKDYEGSKILENNLTENDIDMKFENLNKEYQLLIDDRYQSIYINGGKVEQIKIGDKSKPIKGARYYLLLYFLKNKDTLFNSETLYVEGWSHIGITLDTLPKTHKNNLRNEVSTLNAMFKSLKLTDIEIVPEYSVGYRCIGNCNYCLII